MTPHRLEGHLQLGVLLALRFLQPADLPVRRHDATARRGADLDALAQERGMDTILSQQGILLELADLVADVKRDFADPLVGLWLRI